MKNDTSDMSAGMENLHEFDGLVCHETLGFQGVKRAFPALLVEILCL